MLNDLLMKDYGNDVLPRRNDKSTIDILSESIAQLDCHHKSATADTQCFMHLNLNCSDGALCPPSETRHLKKEENIKGEQGRMDSD